MDNRFDNSGSGHQLEVAYAARQVFNASLNLWATSDARQIVAGLLDGRKIPTRPKIVFSPALTEQGALLLLDDGPFAADERGVCGESCTCADSCRCNTVRNCTECQGFSCNSPRDCNNNGKYDPRGCNLR